MPNMPYETDQCCPVSVYAHFISGMQRETQAGQTKLSNVFHANADMQVHVFAPFTSMLNTTLHSMT